MEYITDAHEAAEIDRLSISEIGIPSLVLMERASMAVFSCLKERFPDREKEKIAVVCGGGNNGGDGVCTARLLFLAGYSVTVFLLGNEEKQTDELKAQVNILENLKDEKLIIKKSGSTQKPDNANFRNAAKQDTVKSGKFGFEEYTVIIDAIFGIGLKREVQGAYAECIDMINCSGAYVISADIPSGINADSGKALGSAVFADLTVTFGTNKRGNILFPGCTHAGETIVADTGFPCKAVRAVSPKAYTYSGDDIFALMPKRKIRSNKGNYGKALVIAGSSGMCGACFFAAMAAYRMGCGLVKILSTEDNLAILKTKLPEALFGCYEDGWQLTASLEWADVVAFGPGIGISGASKDLFKKVFNFWHQNKSCENKREREDKNIPQKIVIDADGLNLLAQEDEWKSLLDENFVLTPHLKEMSRLAGIPVSEIEEDVAGAAVSYSGCHTLVLKDARTVVAGGGTDGIYINTTGNNALATGGSGDVLCGMIAGLLAQGKKPRDAAELAVCVHGLTADSYAKRCSQYSMVASDILDELTTVLNYKS